MNESQINMALAVREAMKAAYDQGYVAGGGDTSIASDPDALLRYDVGRTEVLHRIAKVLAVGGLSALHALADERAQPREAANEG